jgi:hypothetical protein
VGHHIYSQPWTSRELEQRRQNAIFHLATLHNKIVTANNMAKRDWDCNPTCPLCYCQPETGNHLLAYCNFTEALWQSIANLFDLPDYNTMKSKGDLMEWVRYLVSQGSKHWKRLWAFCPPSGGPFRRRETVVSLTIRSCQSLNYRGCCVLIWSSLPELRRYSCVVKAFSCSMV